MVRFCRHPLSGHVVRVNNVVSSLLTLLLGPFYLAARGY